MTNKQVEERWLEFGDVPINDNDEIEEDFYDFPKGTNRFEVWSWFDENHTQSVAYLVENVG